jgi:hypothetical protein
VFHFLRARVYKDAAYVASIASLSRYYARYCSNFLNPDDPGAYFITVSAFSAAHTAPCPAQYSQCPLVRLMPKPPSVSSTGEYYCAALCALQPSARRWCVSPLSDL